MKKILFSLMAIALVAGLVGAGAFAYFNDTETSEGNTFQAGTIDLAVNAQNPWVGKAFTFTDVKPSEDLAEFSVKFENVGNNEGILYTCFDYVENDKSVDDRNWFEFAANMPAEGPNGQPAMRNPAMELTADQFAAIVYVKAVKYQYTCSAEGYVGSWHDDLPEWLGMDLNGDGKVSLYEMKKCGAIPYDSNNDPFPATATIEWKITFHLGDALNNWDRINSKILTGVSDNRPQADGIDGKVSGILLQVADPAIDPTCP